MADPGGEPRPDTGDHEALGDRHVRELLDRYSQLSGATLTELSPHLYEFQVPREDRTAFNQRSSIRLAFSVEAVQTDADAEMAIMGGAFVEQLIGAIRNRGAVHSAGSLDAGDTESIALPRLPIVVRNGKADAPTGKLVRHNVGRLTARVVIRAGTSLEEHLVDSGVFDLSTGVPMGKDVAQACDRHAAGMSQVTSQAGLDATVMPMRPIQDLVGQMLSDLERTLQPQLARLRERSVRELAHEVGRIDRYYQSMLDDIGGRGTDVPDRDSRRVFEAERDRRIAEERDRHEVRATVHPVQLTQWDVLVQRADWPLESTDGHRGTVTAQRVLAGERAWLLACPSCGAALPSALAVCLHDHAACSNCARECSVCMSSFCASHGIQSCHVDLAPACDTHAKTCVSCLKAHCTAHEGTCDEGGHAACTTCLDACAICRRSICDRHAERSGEAAPRGSRRLCQDCARKCEGGSGEIVGKDEAAKCASCQHVVCERHQARCAVDGLVHCSKHLRRTDRSRRLVCEKDRALCSYEPNAVFARDEIVPCTTCGVKGCDQHIVPCVEDGALHCRTHLVAVRDRSGAMACASHHTLCHVDGAAYSMAGTKVCALCAKRVCAGHTKKCVNCGRAVCVTDINSAANACATCAAMIETSDPSDDILAVANGLFESAGRAKRWKTARDASHTVVEADLGWTRRVVFVIKHGEQRAEHAFSRSALGTRKLPT